MLLKIKDEKPQLITLCGLTHEETELDLSRKGLGPADAMLLAPEIAVSRSLTQACAIQIRILLTYMQPLPPIAHSVLPCDACVHSAGQPLPEFPPGRGRQGSCRWWGVQGLPHGG
eukprot:6963900-Prymnesium_polylepis.1